MQLHFWQRYNLQQTVIVKIMNLIFRAYASEVTKREKTRNSRKA
jgi:hypothetical protein